MKEAKNKDPLLPQRKLSFFEIFTYLANRNQKRLIIFLCILFSSSASMILGIPIVFKDPVIICLPENSICLEETACQQEHFIDLENGPLSFSAEFHLICENKTQKTFAITLNFIGIFVGCFFSTFILVSAKRRKTYLGILGLILTACLFAMLFSENSFIAISFLISVCAFCFIYINSFSYLFIGENFRGELAGFVTIIYSVSWAITGIFYAIFAFFTNFNWKLFVIFTGVTALIGGLGVLTTKSDTIFEEGDEDQQMGFFSYLHDMWPNVQIRTNFLVYCFIWSMFVVFYCVILVEIESVGGNLFLNMSICSCIEILAAIFAGTLTAKFSCSSLINKILIFLGIFLSIFVFAPASLANGTQIQIAFFVVCMFLGKLNNDTLNLVIYLYLPKAFTDKYVGFWLIFSRFSSRFLGLFVPYISYLMRSIGFHPFCFYGLVWLFCRFLYMFTKEMQSEGVDDLLNEANANLTERLSVIAGSFSNGILKHDDNLKHIQVDGVPLSVIRMMKQNQNSLKDSHFKARGSDFLRKKKSSGNQKSFAIELKEENKTVPL